MTGVQTCALPISAIPLSQGRHTLSVAAHDKAGNRTEKRMQFVVDSTEPYNEGEPLLAVEADVGEITSVVDPAMLLAGFSNPGYARVALVKGETEMPRIVAQGFLPLARVRDTDLAALVYQVAAHADELEKRIFGGDLR